MDSSLGRLVFDLGSAALLLCVALAGVYLPRYLAKKGRESGTERSLVFQLGNMLSAGVMLSACFCHLLAEALPETERAITNFPLAPFLCALGYLLSLTADQVATKVASSTKSMSVENGVLLGANHVHSHNPQSSPTNGESPFCVQGEELFEGSREHGSDPIQAFETEIPEYSTPTKPRVSFLTTIFLSCALSLHSVLEGLALGAQKEISDSRDILIAIAAHKGLAAYALGANTVDSRASAQNFWRVSLMFSLASPIGIIIGYLISEVSNNVIGSSLSALASGTFLYVAAMEVIPAELETGEHICSKLSIMFLGFGLMSLLARWA